ncbi:MAG TPA: hypothetical protein VGO61_17790 [Steroidobacteraceae bacterium]|jgi:hypothetical protein|nr:hypothetical protein [Steroidobacteraceae bacterium]
MYLDPGSTSLLIQALFALFATVIATYGRSREWLVGLWSQVTRSVIKSRRRTDA